MKEWLCSNFVHVLPSFITTNTFSFCFTVLVSLTRSNWNTHRYEVCSWNVKHKARYGPLLANHSRPSRPWPTQTCKHPETFTTSPRTRNLENFHTSLQKLHDSANLKLERGKKRKRKLGTTATRKSRSGKFHSGWRRDFIIRSLCNGITVTWVLTNLFILPFIDFYIVHQS